MWNCGSRGTPAGGPSPDALFVGVVAALALAFGLAFGLGGREQAAEIWADWRGHANGAIDKAATRPEASAVQADQAALRRRELAIQSS